MLRLERVLLRIIKALDGAGIDFCLVGGLAVSARSEPRFTRDIDLAVSVSEDRDVENLVLGLRTKDFEVQTLLERKSDRKISAVRLQSTRKTEQGILVDLLFNTCRIEREIIDSSELLTIRPKIRVKIALLSHLIAMKVFSFNPKHRGQDLVDLQNMTSIAKSHDIKVALKLISLIEERNKKTKGSLATKFKRLIAK